MHMADALVSPAVGGAFWAASAGLIANCSARLRRDLDDRQVPLMGVLAAFVFAVQMINFAIPGTGSSGHLGGGLLLSILLGPSAAFLCIASVLMVQALFFADGGLLALGCNIFNLGVFPTFVAYPLIFRKLAGHPPRPARLVPASVLAAVAGLQLGSLSVVLQTVTSGVSAVPLPAFLVLMQPLHLAIGIVEGVATALVVSFVLRVRPDALAGAVPEKSPVRSILAAFLASAILVGGVISWFASERPDGLEWSIEQLTGSVDLAAPGAGADGPWREIQDKTVLLPDYALPSVPHDAGGEPAGDPRVGTSLAGLVGGAISLAVCLLLGLFLKRRRHGHALRADR